MQISPTRGGTLPLVPSDPTADETPISEPAPRSSAIAVSPTRGGTWRGLDDAVDAARASARARPFRAGTLSWEDIAAATGLEDPEAAPDIEVEELDLGDLQRALEEEDAREPKDD